MNVTCRAESPESGDRAVAVMKAAEHGRAVDLDGRCSSARSRVRRVALERQMRAVGVVEDGDTLPRSLILKRFNTCGCRMLRSAPDHRF